MSWKYVQAAWSFRAGLSPIEQLVLLEYAERINGLKHSDRGAWPSIQTIAESVGASKRAVSSAIKSLIGRKLLQDMGFGDTKGKRRLTLGAAILNEARRMATHAPPASPDAPVARVPMNDVHGTHARRASEPRNRTKEDEPSPCSPPWGDRLRAFWDQVREREPRAPKAIAITPARIRMFRSRLKEIPEFEQAVLSRLPLEDWCFQRNDRSNGKWFEMDWVLGPKNCAKLIDGKYSRPPHICEEPGCEVETPEYYCEEHS